MSRVLLCVLLATLAVAHAEPAVSPVDAIGMAIGGDERHTYKVPLWGAEIPMPNTFVLRPLRATGGVASYVFYETPRRRIGGIQIHLRPFDTPVLESKSVIKGRYRKCGVDVLEAEIKELGLQYTKMEKGEEVLYVDFEEQAVARLLLEAYCSVAEKANPTGVSPHRAE